MSRSTKITPQALWQHMDALDNSLSHLKFCPTSELLEAHRINWAAIECLSKKIKLHYFKVNLLQTEETLPANIIHARSIEEILVLGEKRKIDLKQQRSTYLLNWLDELNETEKIYFTHAFVFNADRSTKEELDLLSDTLLNFDDLKDRLTSHNQCEVNIVEKMYAIITEMEKKEIEEKPDESSVTKKLNKLYRLLFDLRLKNASLLFFNHLQFNSKKSDDYIKEIKNFFESLTRLEKVYLEKRLYKLSNKNGYINYTIPSDLKKLENSLIENINNSFAIDNIRSLISDLLFLKAEEDSSSELTVSTVLLRKIMALKKLLKLAKEPDWLSNLKFDHMKSFISDSHRLNLFSIPSSLVDAFFRSLDHREHEYFNLAALATLASSTDDPSKLQDQIFALWQQYVHCESLHGRLLEKTFLWLADPRHFTDNNYLGMLKSLVNLSYDPLSLKTCQKLFLSLLEQEQYSLAEKLIFFQEQTILQSTLIIPEPYQTLIYQNWHALFFRAIKTNDLSLYRLLLRANPEQFQIMLNDEQGECLISAAQHSSDTLAWLLNQTSEKYQRIHDLKLKEIALDAGNIDALTSCLFSGETIILTDTHIENLLNQIKLEKTRDAAIKKIHFLWQHGDKKQRSYLLDQLEPDAAKNLGLIPEAGIQETYYLLSKLCETLEKMHPPDQKNPYKHQLSNKIELFCYECKKIKGDCLLIKNDPLYKIIMKMHIMLTCIRDVSKNILEQKEAVQAFNVALSRLEIKQKNLLSKYKLITTITDTTLLGASSLLIGTGLTVMALPVLTPMAGLVASITAFSALLLATGSLFMRRKLENKKGIMPIDKFNKLKEKAIDIGKAAQVANSQPLADIFNPSFAALGRLASPPDITARCNETFITGPSPSSPWISIPTLPTTHHDKIQKPGIYPVAY